MDKYFCMLVGCSTHDSNYLFDGFAYSGILEDSIKDLKKNGESINAENLFEQCVWTALVQAFGDDDLPYFRVHFNFLDTTIYCTDVNAINDYEKKCAQFHYLSKWDIEQAS